MRRMMVVAVVMMVAVCAVALTGCGGDTTKAKAKLGWNPQVKFPELVYEIVKSDCDALVVGEVVQSRLGQPVG